MSLTCTFCNSIQLFNSRNDAKALRKSLRCCVNFLCGHLTISLFTTHHYYSLLKLFTGFAIAAFIACKLIVSNARSTAANPARMNTSQPIFILYAKSCSHLFMKYQASGDAIMIAMTTSFKKSFDSKLRIFETVAPNTFRTPISFVRFTSRHFFIRSLNSPPGYSALPSPPGNSL